MERCHHSLLRIRRMYLPDGLGDHLIVDVRLSDVVDVARIHFSVAISIPQSNRFGQRECFPLSLNIEFPIIDQKIELSLWHSNVDPLADVKQQHQSIDVAVTAEVHLVVDDVHSAQPLYSVDGICFSFAAALRVALQLQHSRQLISKCVGRTVQLQHCVTVQADSLLKCGGVAIDAQCHADPIEECLQLHLLNQRALRKLLVVRFNLETVVVLCLALSNYFHVGFSVRFWTHVE